MYKYNTQIITLATALSLFGLFLKNPYLGISGLIVFSYFVGKKIGQKILPNEHSFWQLIWGIITTYSLNTVILCAVYWIYKIDIYVIALDLVAIFIFTLLFPTFAKTNKKNKTKTSISFSSALWATALQLLQIVILIKIALKIYGDTLVSPWTISGAGLFVAFFITTVGLLLFLLRHSNIKYSVLFLVTLHYAIIICVALLVFKHGFGFDGFVHQAAEKWIIKNGELLPKQPYYLGQYMLSIFTHYIGNIPVDLIDKILVPVGSSILIPFAAFFAFKNQFKNHLLYPAIILLPVLPLTFFTVTTPNNLALLVSFLLFFWIIYESRSHNKLSWVVGVSLILLSLALHPFIGLPLMVFYGAWKVLLNKKNTNRLFLASYGVTMMLIVPLALVLNGLRSGGYLNLQNPLENIEYFTRMFSSPFWYWFDGAPLHWQLLYYFKLSLIPLILIAIGFGMWWARKKYTNYIKLVLVGSIGLFVSAFILSTTLKYPDVISYERSVYAERILEIILISFFPFFVVFWQTTTKTLTKRLSGQIIFSIFAGLLLLFSWYFTYPTRDPISRYTGYAVRDVDIEAVSFIDRINPNTDYIVLTNQTVSAAALKTFGFKNYLQTEEGLQYFYSIPTGGPFYQYFRKMVYEDPKREWMIQAMDFANVDKAYFIHTNYWAPAAEIRDKAKLEADTWWELDNGRLWIYEYTK